MTTPQMDWLEIIAGLWDRAALGTGSSFMAEAAETVASMQDEIGCLSAEVGRLQDAAERLAVLVNAVDELRWIVANSSGVVGLRSDGQAAAWGDLP